MTLLRLAALRPADRRARVARRARQPRATARIVSRSPATARRSTDATTKLIWRRCAEGLRWDGKACAGKVKTFKYGEAKDDAANVAKADSKAWRIPTKDELVSLVDKTAKKKPRIDVKVFPQTPSLPFWAMRPGSDDDLNAWLVNFANGKVHGNAGQRKFPLRLVRSSA